MGAGVGGSGLYSDGKFSFFPSATRLWDLTDRDALRRSWDWFSSLLAQFGIDCPDLPHVSGTAVEVVSPVGGSFGRKEYRSEHLSFERRKTLIERLQAECGPSLHPESHVHELRFDSASKQFRCTISTGNGSSVLTARRVVCAGGRFAPLGWNGTVNTIPKTFRRAELGVRLEQPSESFFLRGDHFLDPKLISTSADGRYGWRTFCCCRDGQVIATEVLGVCSVSGRADCPPTGVSNVGFNLRITDEAFARSLWPEGLETVARAGGAPVRLPLDDYLSAVANRRDGEDPVARVFGPRASRLLAEGLERLRASYRDLQTVPCTVVAPAIEGVGYYPALSDNLRCGPAPLWVAGDGTGVFRGLTAAMVSGHFAALQAVGFTEDSP